MDDSIFTQRVRLKKRVQKPSSEDVDVPAMTVEPEPVPVPMVKPQDMGSDAASPTDMSPDLFAPVLVGVEVETPDKPAQALVGVEPDSLALPEEVEVYHGSLYAWCVLWVLAIMGATQAVKRVARYPLVELGKPFRMSDATWDWAIRSTPFIFSFGLTPYFGPAAAEAFGFEFTWFGSLIFAPGAALAAMGSWSFFPKPIRLWLDGIKTDDD